jgi:hypothetical protein
MNIHDKSLKVIRSCETLEQLQVANKYLDLALPTIGDKLLHMGLLFEWRFARERLQMTEGSGYE